MYVIAGLSDLKNAACAKFLLRLLGHKITNNTLFTIALLRIAKYFCLIISILRCGGT